MRDPIRILQVFSVMNRGGAESMIMNIYRNVDRSKVQFDFIVHSTEPGDFDEEIYSLGGRIYSVPRYKGINHVDYVKQWEYFFKKHGYYSIIHGHIRSTASIYLKIAKNNNLLTIAHSHSTSNGKGFESLVKMIFQRKIKVYSDYLFAASSVAGEWLFGKKTISNDNFYILNNAIETSKYIYDKSVRENKKRELGIENQTIVGHVGNFKEVKNHSFLFDIFKEFQVSEPDSLLLLVGDGKLRDEFTEKVKQYNLTKKVIFLGSRSDVNELLQAMDIFVFPSIYEGLPVTVIEAQASGLPCLLSNTITEEVAITNNIHFMSLNEPATIWSEKMFDVLRNHKRESMEKEIYSSNYDAKKIAKSLQEFYIHHNTDLDAL